MKGHGKRENLGHIVKKEPPKFSMQGTHVQVAGFTRPLIENDEAACTDTAESA